MPRLGINAGVNLSPQSDLRVGASEGTLLVSRDGRPGLAGAGRSGTGVELNWRVDTQDSPVVPAGGMYFA